VLKWVGAITAILSLIFAVYQLTGMISADRERQRNLEELHNVARAQQDAGNYPAALETFEQAVKEAEEGGLVAKMFGRLSEDRRRVREAQEDLAMVWLKNISARNGQTFSETVDKLLPILDRGVANAAGQRKADLLAHVGWAYFLKTRDGQRDLHPEQQYAEALKLDPSNPYAHAYLGHWSSWRRGGLEDVRKHFSAALASGRSTEHVRAIELAAFENFGSRGDSDYVHVVNDMRKRNEKIDSGARSKLLSIYFMAFNNDRFDDLNTATPPAEQVATLQALFTDSGLDDSKRRLVDAYIATLQEASGARDDALKTWTALRADLPTDGSSRVASRANEAIKRLSAQR
jgi:tetratricopeptide (TPR) repeat protein